MTKVQSLTPYNTILIFGATSNVARETAILHAKQGAKKIILSARDTEKLEPLVQHIKLVHGAEVSLLKLDAFNMDGCEDVLIPLIKESDMCYSFWGYLGEQKKAETDWKECWKQVEANYTACVRLLNIVAEIYEERKSGIIVGVSSVAGERGRQSNYIYGSAKAGFTVYLSGLRNRLFKSGVHVVTVLPGFMRTKMTEGLNLPPAITSDPDKAANIIVKGALKKENVVYVSAIWRYIMLIIKYIPEFIFKKLTL
jgi:short-subunit dehydrogenase